MTFVTEMVKDGMLNRNEGRAEFDYSPVDDEAMNEYNVLENYIPVGKVGEQKKLKGGENGEYRGKTRLFSVWIENPVRRQREKIHRRLFCCIQSGN